MHQPMFISIGWYTTYMLPTLPWQVAQAMPAPT